MQIIKCKQTSHLKTLLKNPSKTPSQIHQIHAQALTHGLLTLHPSYLLTQILHSLISPPKTLPPKTLNYTTKIFNLIPNPKSPYTYNSIIRTHTLSSSFKPALHFFVEMRRNSIPPDSHTYPFLLKALQKNTPLLLVIRTLHSDILKHGFSEDVYVCNTLACAYFRAGDVRGADLVLNECLIKDVVSYNVMIDGFVKAGEIGKARKVFDEMPQRDGVSYGTLLSGYAKWGFCEEALDLFDEGVVDGNVRFDNVAFVSCLSACARLGELEKGRRIHERIVRDGIVLDSYLGTGLVDLYSKCGCIELAKEVFESCGVKNVSLWNAMLAGLAMHGDGVSLMEYFEEMVGSGGKPDGVTILAVLVGCSHSGMIGEAKRVFREMESVYGVRRELKHYGCMADLLGRAGLINEAVEMISGMPMVGDVFVWGGLLGGCKIHGNLEVGELAANRVMEVKPEDGGVYSVLAHLYANSHRWDDLVKVRRLRDCRWGIKKSAGCSLIELDRIKHEFVSGDCLHVHTDEIYFVLNCLEMHQYETL